MSGNGEKVISDLALVTGKEDRDAAAAMVKHSAYQTLNLTGQLTRGRLDRDWAAVR